MATRVELRQRGAVGAAEDVDPLVAEHLPDALDVVGRGLARQHPRVAAEAGEAPAEVRGDRVGVGRPHVLLRTHERVRAARPALIDEHEVAVLADVREHLVDLDRGVRRNASRSALEIEERSARRLPGGRDDRDVQRDGPPLRPGRVYRHAQLGTARIDAIPVRAGVEGDALRRVPAVVAPGEPDGNRGDDHRERRERDGDEPASARRPAARGAVVLEPGVRPGHVNRACSRTARA